MSPALLEEALESAGDELGASTRAGYFGAAAAALREFGGDRPIPGEVILSAQCGFLQAPLLTRLGTKAQVISGPGAGNLCNALMVPSCRIYVFHESELAGSAMPAASSRVMADEDSGAQRLVMISLTPSDDLLKQFPPELGPVCVRGEQAPELIETMLAEEAAAHSKVAAERQCKRIARRAQMIVAEELQALEMRKLLVSDEIAASRKLAAPASQDASARIRTILQKNLQEAERAFKVKYDELNRARQGPLPKAVDDFMYRMADTDLAVRTLASKTETSETEIREQFEEKFVTAMRGEIEPRFKEDMQFIAQVREMTIDQIDHVLWQEGCSGLTRENLVVPEPAPTMMLDTHFHINKRYRGEITKDGVMQYFVALRDYTGMIMVVVGILAPLTLIATSPDAAEGSFLAFINKLSREMKSIRAYVTFVTAILVGGMLVYGFVDLRHRIPRKRIEERERELGKARESLTAEGKRMFSETARDWVTQVSSYLRELQTAIGTEIERLMRAKASNVSQVNEERRREIALRQASIENRLKSLGAVARKLENAAR